MTGVVRLIAMKYVTLRTALVLVAILLGCQAAEGGELRRIRSRHYEMLSDLPDADARRVATHMDKMYDLYLQRFGRYGVRNGEPLKLWVFNDEAQYQSFLASNGINGAHSGGMFFIREDARGLASFLGERGMERMLETLRHEGMHQVAYQRIAEGLPTWCSEGMAEFFGYAVEAGNTIEPGVAAPGAIARLRAAKESGQLFTLREMLYMSRREWGTRLSSGDARAVVMYDQAWSLVHFLVNAERGRYERLLMDYVHACWQGLQPEQATEKVFGRDLGPMQEKWEAYLDELRSDPLLVAQMQLGVVADVLLKLDAKGHRPTESQEIVALVREQGILPIVPEGTAEWGEWWWLTPIESKRGRETTLKIRPVRGRKADMPIVEIVGLRRRVQVRWIDDGSDGPGYEIVFR